MSFLDALTMLQTPSLSPDMSLPPAVTVSVLEHLEAIRQLVTPLDAVLAQQVQQPGCVQQ